MKTEFLTGLGLEQSVIDKIMAENGKDIKAEQKKYADYDAIKSENNTLKTEKTSLEDKIKDLSDKSTSADDYKKQLDDLQQKIADEKAEAEKKKADEELTESITAVFGDKKFTSDYVKNGIIADMKAEISKAENKGKGYADIFESLTKDKDK